MYEFTFHGFKFNLDAFDWAPNTQDDKETAFELFCDAMQKLSPEVIAQAHSGMLADQAEGDKQFAVLNGEKPESLAYEAVKNCEVNAAKAVFRRWNRWPSSGHNFMVTAA